MKLAEKQRIHLISKQDWKYAFVSFLLIALQCTSTTDLFSAAVQRAHKKSGGRSSVSARAKKAPTKKTELKTSATKQIADRQRELMSLQKSIEEDRNKISALREQEKSTVQSIARYRRHSQNIRRYVKLLEDEIESLQDKATTARNESDVTAGDLWRLRQRYAVLVQNMMKNNLNTQSVSLLSPSRANDAALEGEAMRRVSSQAKETFRRLADKRDSLTDASQKLHSRSEMRAVLLAVKDSEQKELERTIVATEKALSAIRNDKSQVLLHLKKNERSAAEVSRLITNMVANENSLKSKTKKSTKEESNSSKNHAPSGTSSTAKVSMKAKSLPYPVASHKILHSYGTYKNTVTNTLTNNPGVDIATPQGSNVSVVAAGTVSLIHWLPGYGSVVIIDHHNGFRSVYANLNSVTVKKGQNVSAQQVIAKSSESIDGEFVHLEFWFEKQRVNPLNYLR